MFRKRIKKRICVTLAMMLLIGTVVYKPVNVRALSAGGLQTTIASIIVSLMVQAGAAPVSQSFVNTLNASYGVESSIGTIQDCITSGLLTESGGTLIDTGLSTAIENASAYTDLGLGQIFSTTADDVGVAVASGGTNLATTAINTGTLGTIGAFAGAAAIGVGIGVLARKLNAAYMDRVINGLPEDALINPNLANYKYKYYCTYKESGYNRTITINAGSNQALDMCYRRGQIYLINKGSEVVICPLSYCNKDGWQNRANGHVEPISYYIYNGGGVSQTGIVRGNGQQFDTAQECIDYCNAVLSGAVTPARPVSPDLIGPNGNLSYDADSDSIPGLGEADPSNYDMNPIPMDVYQDFVNDANNNTENGDTQLPQGNLFDDLIDDYLVQPPIIPGEQPGDIEYGDHPLNPDQPTIPGKEPPTQEQVTETLGGATPPDLRTVFPFCIPFDLLVLVRPLENAERKAPKIEFTFPFNEDWKISVDLSAYDSAAALLRKLELLLFIVGLAMVSRYLIGA